MYVRNHSSLLNLLIDREILYYLVCLFKTCHDLLNIRRLRVNDLWLLYFFIFISQGSSSDGKSTKLGGRYLTIVVDTSFTGFIAAKVSLIGRAFWQCLIAGSSSVLRAHISSNGGVG
jgi:hypothetical protein